MIRVLIRSDYFKTAEDLRDSITPHVMPTTGSAFGVKIAAESVKFL